jgi:hypothetical protein
VAKVVGSNPGVGRAHGEVFVVVDFFLCTIPEFFPDFQGKSPTFSPTFWGEFENNVGKKSGKFSPKFRGKSRGKVGVTCGEYSPT